MKIKDLLPIDGPSINEVNKYIDKYNNDLIVIKYGGNVFIDRNIFNNFIKGFFVNYCSHKVFEIDWRPHFDSFYLLIPLEYVISILI